MHECRVDGGNAHCDCKGGYKLAEDGKTCEGEMICITGPPGPSSNSGYNDWVIVIVSVSTEGMIGSNSDRRGDSYKHSSSHSDRHRGSHGD